MGLLPHAGICFLHQQTVYTGMFLQEVSRLAASEVAVQLSIHAGDQALPWSDSELGASFPSGS